MRKKTNNTKKKHLERHFGIQAIERGFITSENLTEVMVIQDIEKKYKGKHRFIGRILLDKGLISITQIDEVLESMGQGPALGLR